MSQLAWLDPSSFEFPDTRHSLDDPNGLLAVGGDLSIERIVSAYSQGIFPWFSDGQPILWWSPSPRMILEPNKTHIGRTLRKLINKKRFKITTDLAFADVIQCCADIPRHGEDGTWITDEMQMAYQNCHHAGFAHSIEAWMDDQLVGGLYGIAIGKIFFGESMFSLVSGASKVAFAALARYLSEQQYLAIDCQIHTDYLASFGAEEIPRPKFESILNKGICRKNLFEKLTNQPQDWKQKWTLPEHGFD